MFILVAYNEIYVLLLPRYITMGVYSVKKN